MMNIAAPPPPDFLRKAVVGQPTSSATPLLSSTVHNAQNNSSSNTATAKAIDSIRFSMFNGSDIVRTSVLEVTSRELYKMGSRITRAFGCLDNRLGVSNKSDVCGTCNCKIEACSGHFGYIALELPVFHIGFLRATIDTLQCVCKTCSRVLLPPADRKSFVKIMRNNATDGLKKARIRKKVSEEAKKVAICGWCGALNGQVKKVPGAQSFKIIHDRWKTRGDSTLAARQQYEGMMDTATALAPELGPHVKKAVENLTPLRVRELFAAIPDEDCTLLWADPVFARPEDMVLTHVFVPPVIIRPSVPMDAGGGSNEDDLTIKLQEIIHVNTALRLALNKGASMRMVQENWDFLQVQVAALINGELPGLPPAMKSKRPIRGLAQRLKGKQGRFRGNLSGKRVDFSSRTVISPDPNLPLYCVGVPVLVARDLTFPERVNEINIAQVRKWVENGPDIHPGANYVKTAGALLNLRFANRVRAAANLKIGDVVERHLMNGDPVLFNRQPSLHKMSIMCHRAVVLPWRTFRFNECVCTPYNADFDGDEMNLHLPQTLEARSEAALLMDVRENLITPRSGEPLIAATQDFLTAAYLLTRRDTFLTKDEFMQAVATLGDASEHIDIPPPTIFKPFPLWTGKQVFNLLLKPNKSIDLHTNFETKARNYTSKEYLCPDDGWVIFRDGALMTGNLCKATLGGGSKKGLVYMLCRDENPSVAAVALHRLTKMTSRWLMNWGFTIGIEDVAPAAHLSQIKDTTVKRGYDACDDAIAKYKKGTLQLQPGCNEEQTLEVVLNGILSKLREELGNMCMRELPASNPPRIMATCGSKGSTINIAQMVACVGQQSVGGSRIAEGFVDRTLPAFPSKAKEPAAKGFVANSFYTGLTGSEFFFHTMGGREGLVDTAVKTAETGYMQRRMMKALEDLAVQYDNTVRSSAGDVIQFHYGDDGLDPAYMEGNGRPADLERLFLHASIAIGKGEKVPPARARKLLGNQAGQTNANMLQDFKDRSTLGQADQLADPEPRLSPAECRALYTAALNGPLFRGFKQPDNDSEKNPNPGGQKFLDEITEFFEKQISRLEKRLKDVSLTGTNVHEHLGNAAASGLDTTTVDAINAMLTATASESRDGPAFVRFMPDTLTLRTNPDWLWIQEGAAVVHNTFPITRSVVLLTLENALAKYRRSRIQPGEAVGAVAAHSMGEPATQMTLKTFHFAGVASMNVTLGVPRIKEIMNASRIISTPIIEAYLENDLSDIAGRMVKARLEKTCLGDVAKYIREVYDAHGAHLEISLDLSAIQSLHLEITSQTVAAAIQKSPKLRLKEEHVNSPQAGIIHVYPPRRQAASRQRAARQRQREKAKEEERLAMEDAGRGGKEAKDAEDDDADEEINMEGADIDFVNDDLDEDMEASNMRGRGSRKGTSDYILEMRETQREDTYYGMQALKAALPQVIVQGIATVNRAVITQIEEEDRAKAPGPPKYKLLVEGYDLLRVMGTPGVNYKASRSNHVIEMLETLGVEAARVVIQTELARTYGIYGIGIDQRHLRLLADIMTSRGEVLGITRFGIARMKDSVLMLASFEKTPDHLFDAAIHARKDDCKGVSESIIIGAPVPLGTGLFRLMHQFDRTDGTAGETPMPQVPTFQQQLMDLVSRPLLSQ